MRAHEISRELYIKYPLLIYVPPALGSVLKRNLKNWQETGLFIPAPPLPYALSPSAQNYTCFLRKESEWGKWF